MGHNSRHRPCVCLLWRWSVSPAATAQDTKLIWAEAGERASAVTMTRRQLQDWLACPWTMYHGVVLGIIFGGVNGPGLSLKSEGWTRPIFAWFLRVWRCVSTDGSMYVCSTQTACTIPGINKAVSWPQTRATYTASTIIYVYSVMTAPPLGVELMDQDMASHCHWVLVSDTDRNVSRYFWLHACTTVHLL